MLEHLVAFICGLAEHTLTWGEPQVYEPLRGDRSIRISAHCYDPQRRLCVAPHASVMVFDEPNHLCWYFAVQFDDGDRIVNPLYRLQDPAGWRCLEAV
jgi:hypothetical protein